MRSARGCCMCEAVRDQGLQGACPLRVDFDSDGALQ
jgi:hypothetical protein